MSVPGSGLAAGAAGAGIPPGGVPPGGGIWASAVGPRRAARAAAIAYRFMAHSLRRGVQACPRRRCGSTRFGTRTRAVTPEAAGHPGNPARPRPAGRSARPAVTRFLARELADVLDPTDAQGVPLIPLLA